MRDMKNKHRIIPRINKHVVLDVIRNNSPVSINDIGRMTEISKPTIVKILNELCREKSIIKKGKGESAGGRRPDLYHFNTLEKFVIGILFEIPGVNITAFDLNTEPLYKKQFSVDTSASTESIVAQLVSALAQVIDAVLENHDTSLAGIGLAMSGFISKEQGISLSTPRMPQWKHVQIVELLKKEFQVPINLMSGGNARMLAEIKFGEHQKTDNLLYILFQEGIGASILINGIPLEGKYGNAGNMSHIIINHDGLKCICGQTGCLECYASERGLLDRLNRQALKQKNPKMREPKITGIQDAIGLMNQAPYKHIFDEMSYYLGVSIANLITLLEIDYVILGGSLATFGEAYLESIESNIKSKLSKVHKSSLKLVCAKLNDIEAGAIGAVDSIINELYKEPELPVVTTGR